MNPFGALMIFNTAFGIFNAMQQADRLEQAAVEAEALARENRAMAEAETEEEARRARKEQEETESAAMARMYASGTVGGSLQESVFGIKKEHEKQLAWLIQSGKSRARLEYRKGVFEAQKLKAEASTTLAKGISQGISSATSTYLTGKQQKWWS